LASRDDELLRQVGGPSPETLERLIYIVGSARGGTTITNRIVGLHDRVIALGGPSHFLNHVWRYRNVVHDRLWRQLLWTPSYLRRSKVRNKLPEDRRRAYLKLINRAMAEKDLHNLYRLYPLVRALDPDETRAPDSFVAWLDKGNDFWGIDRLARAFPRGQFVFVVRDPRGAVASLAKRTADLRADTRFSVEPVDVIDTAIYWRNLIRQQARFARRHRDRTVFFRFEDLTQRPLELTRLIFDALGLPPVPDAELQARLDTLAYKASLDRNERGTGISTAPNERWKERLDQRTLDLVSEICGPGARAFGYSLPVPSRRRGWLGILRLVPGARHKAAVAAKLAFLALTDRPQPTQPIGAPAIAMREADG
jgi:hypothetical protein